MATALNRIRNYVTAFQFKKLFIEELGWNDAHSAPLTVNVDGTAYTLRLTAEKRGLAVLACPDIPPYAVRRRIDKEVTKYHREHLIVFAAPDQSAQVWLWVRREPGKPAAGRERHYYRGESGERVAQTLAGLMFTLEEEEQLTLIEGVSRVRAAFDVDRVTKKFYDRFKREHDTFLKFIRGIPDQEFQRWYASVMLNRMMFIYFMQRKGFMDGDTNYLATRLAQMVNNDSNYYRDFLRVLFFQGFAAREQERAPAVNRLLGNVPYLNGGLFAMHTVEEKYGDAIQIENEAFETLFAFFDEYNWHLDERPLRNDREINPDVLGYIFEKYINQKQMGAYYTKEDITDYICKYVIIPYLFDAVRREYPAAFDASADLQVMLGQRRAGDVPTVWRLLGEDPNRYIYSAVSHGAELTLPPNIAAGIADVSQRGDWNRSADSDYALPTEIWREVVARRTRYAEVRAKLVSGEVTRIDDLITFNLDIRQFARDVIDTSEDPALLRQLWQAIVAITVLDPTGGSGAFLFAALTILEDLYDACLERMEWFLAERQGDTRLNDFREILAEVGRHPNRRYFILKSIIVNNLYAVDIMEEAVEICKLRLFLKLVAQIDRADQIEPLPDIDFNIRAGNTLVGFVTREHVQLALERTEEGQGRMVFGEEQSALARIEEKAKEIDRAFLHFRQLQTQIDVPADALSTAKARLKEQLRVQEEELNRLLAREYGVKVEREADYRHWLESHKPFHWFVEFYGVLQQGGFNAIVGNPPYVEYTQVANDYSILDANVRGLGNLHAMVTKRCLSLASSTGSMSLIVPVALPSTDRFANLRQELLTRGSIWTAHFDFRPAKLFDGAEQRLTIFVLRSGQDPQLYSTRYNRWYVEQRPHLFSNLCYTRWNFGPLLRNVWPKLDGSLSASVIAKVMVQSGHLASIFGRESTKLLYYKNTGILYFTTFTLSAPICFINGQPASSSRQTTLRLKNEQERRVVYCILNSTLFYLCYEMHSNCRDLNPSDISSFSYPPSLFNDSGLLEIAHQLDSNQQTHSQMRIRNQRLTGEVKLQTFRPALAKRHVDDIDSVFAKHYGFTDEELDYIINYDIKYRLGADDGDEDGE